MQLSDTMTEHTHDEWIEIFSRLPIYELLNLSHRTYHKVLQKILNSNFFVQGTDFIIDVK